MEAYETSSAVRATERDLSHVLSRWVRARPAAATAVIAHAWPTSVFNLI